jgi:hypothetical protein
MTSRKVSKSGQTAKSTKAASLPASGKDPAGGLTAKGRKFYKNSDGANLRPRGKGPCKHSRKDEAQRIIFDPSFHSPKRTDGEEREANPSSPERTRVGRTSPED